MVDEFVDADRLRAATSVRHVEIHDTLDSTNNLAVELARDTDIELPALVIARHQTAGRGRGKNTWWSADGALTFSIVLEPAALGITTANWPQLSLATAVAVCDALELRIAECGMRIDEDNPQSEIRNPKSTPRLGIKWPNDVMLDSRKVCGILIESPGGPAPANSRLIIGVGINVNNSLRTAPLQVTRKAIALCDVADVNHDLQIILLGFLHAMQERLGQLRSKDARLASAWKQLCSLTDHFVQVQSGKAPINGRCCGIADDGALIVETTTGRQRIYSGTVQIVP